MIDIEGRTVLVVGASAGIGRESARWFARQGARVVAVGRREDRLRELADSESFTHPIVVCAADVTGAGEPERVVAEAVAAVGTIDLVLYAAAISPMGLLVETDAAQLTDVFVTNVVAPAQVCRAVIPHLAPDAIVAFMSSESVGRPRRALVPYTASKAALEETIKGWRTEHPDVRFSTICVGATIGTDFSRDFGSDILGDALMDWIRTGQLPERNMEPPEVGETIAQILAVAMVHAGVDVTTFAVQPPGPLASL